MLAEIRQFFAERSVLEVETPLLGHSIGTDPQLEFFTTEYCLFPGMEYAPQTGWEPVWRPPRRQTLFLQTSPEFAMKRLLAAGSGSIYQIGKAFRNGESGRFHNPEFTMLEWYRVGFTLPQLMDEIAELIDRLFSAQSLQETQRVSYQDVFVSFTGLDPLLFSYQDYCAVAVESDLPEAVDICGQDHALWLDFLFSHKVQPHLGENALCMVYGYPACQSSLARINEQCAQISDRVELFIKGVELGNGYYELADAEDGSASLREGKVHAALAVFEDAQTGDLGCHLRSDRGRVSGGDTEQHQESGADAPHRFAVHQDAGFAHPLDHGAQASTPRRGAGRRCAPGSSTRCGTQDGY